MPDPFAIGLILLLAVATLVLAPALRQLTKARRRAAEAGAELVDHRDKIAVLEALLEARSSAHD